jgi:hypothetical protein
MRVISQASMRSHVLKLPSTALAAQFRPVAERMLAWAGVTWTAPSLDRARAVVGWFAANAVHPQQFLHPDGTTANVGVLPAGETWGSFNALFNQGSIINRDLDYWFDLFPDGITMLDRLIGTVAPDGAVTDNGMLTEYEPGKWRIRNFADYRAPQCTHQSKMAQVILASMGIPSYDISTVGHDPMAFYEIETGRWLYIDPTFGEMLKLGDRYLTPLDLVMASPNGQNASIAGEKLPGADYIVVGYFTSPAYPAGGMSYMTIHTAPQWAGGPSDRAAYRFGALPGQSAANDRVGTVDDLMPVLGAAVAGLESAGGTVEIRLRSSWPEHVGFERSTDGGASWTACGAIDHRLLGSGQVRYRSVNPEPLQGTPAVVSL